MTRLVIGLGNPGPEYDWTRHNVGFHVCDRIAEDAGVLFRSARRLDGYAGATAFQVAQLPEGDGAGWLMKPETFMNRSGDVVAPFARHLVTLDPSAAAPPVPVPDDASEEERVLLEGRAPELDPARVLVVYDDLDLEPAKLRIRPHGGAGGHNGMRSIISRLGTDRFPRLRIGVGRQGTDAARHVLSRFTDSELVEIEISVAEASEAICAWLESGDIEGVMSRFHSRWNQDS